jgi:hypothetical protein
MNETQPPRQVGRSIGALLAGFIVGAALSLSTDEILHLARVFPPWAERNSGSVLLLALSYRIPYSVVGSYIIARLAPNRPMLHALIGGVVGLVLSVAGAAATWNRDLGPHWYPVAVAAIALPCAWLGGALRRRQLRTERA